MIESSYTLSDTNTKEMALDIATFTGVDDFAGLSRYNYFSMFLVTSGNGKVVRDGTEYAFDAGCLLCFSLFQPFAVKPETELKGIRINFQRGFFCLFKHRNEVSCNGVLFNNLYDTPVVNLDEEGLRSLQIVADQMKVELQRPQPNHDMLLSYLKIFLIEASRIKMEQRQMEVAAYAKKNPVLDRLQQAIDTHFKTHRKPADYAELLHISEKALNKACKEYFKKTLTNLIVERLIIEAKRELYLTAKPVKQVAYELGYNDEFYFSRFFKKNVGVSPQLFRDKVGFNRLND